MPKFHTLPNQATTRVVTRADGATMHVCVASRDREALAYYPAPWQPKSWLPTLAQLRMDARWQYPAVVAREITLSPEELFELFGILA